MRWLLRLLVGQDDLRAFESDLAELYQVRRRHDGERAAARWLRRQRVVFPLHVIADRMRAVVSGEWTGVAHIARDTAYGVR